MMDSLIAMLLFTVGSALVFLLQQPDLLPSPSQRLSAITILHELYRGEPPPNNPFLPVFINILVSYYCLTLLVVLSKLHI